MRGSGSRQRCETPDSMSLFVRNLIPVCSYLEGPSVLNHPAPVRSVTTLRAPVRLRSAREHARLAAACAGSKG